jgi:hypothetical protein
MGHETNGCGNGAAEREIQAAYWKEHSCEATVESMMLDSKASDIDKMERPEVSIKCDELLTDDLFGGCAYKSFALVRIIIKLQVGL